MPTVVFADLDALRRALADGTLSPALTAAPARAGFDANGHLWLEPTAPLTRDTAAALVRFGAAVRETCDTALTESLVGWPQLLPLQPAALLPPETPVPVLFDLGDPRQVPPLVAGFRR